MTLALVRAALESAIATSLSPVPVVFDNTDESPPPLPYARATVTFNTTNSDNLGGCTCPFITGTAQVTVYTPKQEGSSRAELLATQVLLGWEGLAAARWDGTGARVVPRAMEGPRTLAPGQRNAHAVAVMTAFSAGLG
jgi:hypothetical protein